MTGLRPRVCTQGKSEKDIKNLRQEIEILRQLRHENIIQMLDAFETKTEFCVVTGGAEQEQRLLRPPDDNSTSVLDDGPACPGCRNGTCKCHCGCMQNRLRACCQGHPMHDAFDASCARCGATAHVAINCAEYAQGELFEILEDDQNLPEEVVRHIAKQLVREAWRTQRAVVTPA